MKTFPFFAGLVLLSTEVLERRGKSTFWARSSWPNSWHAAVSGTGDPRVHCFCVITTLKGETHVTLVQAPPPSQLLYLIQKSTEKSLFFRHNESSIQNLHNRSLSNTWTSLTGFHGSHRTMFVILPVWSTWPAVMSQIRTWIKNSSMPWKVLQSEWFAVWVGIKLPDLVLIFGCKLAAGNLGQWFLMRLLAGMSLLHKGNFHVVAGGWGKGSWQWSCADSGDYHPLSWLILLGVAAAVTRLCYERCPNWMHNWMVPTTNKVRGCLAEDSHIISCILLRSVSEASRDSGNTYQLKEDYLFPSFLPQKRKIIQQLPCLVGCESTGHDYADSKLLGEQGVLGPFSEVTKDEVRRHSILFDTCVCWYRLGIPKEPGNMPCQKPRWGVHCYSGPLCARKAWP